MGDGKIIAKEVYEKALFETIKRRATVISAAVRQAFRWAIQRDSSPAAKRGLESNLIKYAWRGKAER